MSALHQNQEKILDHLLSHADGCTLEELSNHLGLTKTAAKSHVFRLIHLEHVTFIDLKGQVGRPKRYYKLTESGQEVFPRQYAWISNLLLEFLVENQSQQETISLMERLADKVIQSLDSRFHPAMSQLERIKAVNQILNELGYRTTLTQSDMRKGITIEAINCVYHSVAKQHPELCQFDISLIQRLSGMTPKLESCIAKGQGVCRFCLKPEKIGVVYGDI